MTRFPPPRRPYDPYHPYGAPDPYGGRARQRRGGPAEPAAPPKPESPPAPDPALLSRIEALTAEVAELKGKADALEGELATEREQASEQRGKAESYLDLLQRTQADFVNFKRRAERDREEVAQAARGDLLVQLLPALDDLERALGQVPEDLQQNAWAEGMPLIARRLRLALAKAGLTPVGAPGELFDPHLHEAIAYQPHAGYEEGQIASVIRPGYRLGEKVIRPAQVLVAQGKS